MLVLAEVVSRDLAFEAARGDHRHLALESDEALEDHRRRAQRAVDGGDVGAFADQRLALAVVTEAPGLEDRGAAELGHRAHQRARILDADEGRGQAESRRNVFSVSRSWVSASARAPGRTGLALRKKFDRRRRHVLELEGDDVDASAKRASAASSS